MPVYDSYARLSWNPNTRELEKIEPQWADNARVIDRMGGKLGEPLSDGLSAWKRGVRRPGWERLLERVESGESDGIVVWHTDRGQSPNSRPCRIPGAVRSAMSTQMPVSTA